MALVRRGTGRRRKTQGVKGTLLRHSIRIIILLASYSINQQLYEGYYLRLADCSKSLEKIERERRIVILLTSYSLDQQLYEVKRQIPIG